MNGRVGEWFEFSQLDKNVNTNYNITRSIAETSRRNCDKETNNIGENVIHLIHLIHHIHLMICK